MDLNRDILECKYIMAQERLRIGIYLNRDILECK